MASSTPITVATVASVFVVLFISLVIVSVGGSVLLTLHTIHAQEAIQAAQMAAAKAAQIKAAVPTCRALLSLDHAKDGIHFSPPTRKGTAELYVLRLVRVFHRVVVASKCQALLRLAARTPG